MNENYKFAKFIRINNKYKAYNDEKEIIKLYEKEVNNLQSKIDKAIEYIDKHFQDDEGIVCKITGEYEAERNENFIKEILDILKEAENVENN